MNPKLEKLTNDLGFSEVFHLDFETFSECDINAGTRAYASHPSTEILLAAYAYNNDEPDLYDLAAPVEARKFEIAEACADPDVLLIAWNVPFEREILKHVWGVDTPPEKWLDAMVVAYSMSLPGSLGDASRVLGLDEDKAKDAAGKKLIQKFSKPQAASRKIRRHDWTTDPEDWAKFGEYCKQDVVAERACLNRMGPFLPRAEDVADWHIDQHINARGMPVDLDLVEAAQIVGDGIKARLKKECSVLTGLDNPNSTAQFLPWIQEHGYPFSSLGKDKVSIAQREHDLPDIAARALDLRAQFSRSSTSKYPKIESQTVDGRLCYTLQFNGAARTGRWSGRGAQFQNLPRPPKYLEKPEAMETAVRAVKSRDPDLMLELYARPMDVLAGTIRPTVRARDGYILRVADYNAIENRVLGWVARCNAILDVFRNGLDPYKDFGTRLFNKPYDEITKLERTYSKPAVLGAGYMLGGGMLKTDKKTGEQSKTGLWGYAEALGIELSMEDSQRAVRIFRAEYPEVVELWANLDNAFRRVIAGKGATTVKIPVGFDGRCLVIGRNKQALYVTLPSGRRLWYIQPRLQDCRMPWDNEDGTPVYKIGITYMNQDQTTRKWRRVNTHSGKITENCVSGAAEVLTDRGWVRLDMVEKTDKVHDGVEFVSHAGKVYKGVQACVEIDGVKMTPDHEVLTDEGWKEASENPRPYRPAIRETNDRSPRKDGREKPMVGLPVRLRANLRKDCRRPKKRRPRGEGVELRLLKLGSRPGEKNHPRHEPTPRVRRVAEHGRPVPAAQPSGMEELRRPGHNSVPGMVRVFRCFLARYGAYLQNRFTTGPEAERRGLQRRKLPMGRAESKFEEQAVEPVCGVRRGENNGFGGQPENGDRGNNPALPTGQRVDGTGTILETRCSEPVYDLLNCGPRSRFVVRGSSGPFIVHNCVQAIACDVLRAGLRNGVNAGFSPILHVHDEIVTEERIDDSAHSVEKLEQAMCIMPEWCRDLPMAAAGYESPFYMKD